jgi:threonine dehydrogenase-like Zn-dependent dehydrogenase
VRAVVFDGVGRVRLADVADPEVREPGDAVVRVTRAAICGSDLHFFHGKAPIDPGDVLGHEAVGVIQAVGADVTRFAPGDRVVVAFNIACGVCWFCRRGETQLCEEFRNLGAGAFGGGLAGAQATYVRIPTADVNLLRIPEGVDDERALFVGDALTTGFYAASIAGIEPADAVAVVGCGPVGFFCMQAARALGAERVFAIDLEPSRLVLAARLGAIPIDARERHPQTALAEATEGRGADVVLEAVGSPAAFESAIGIVRRGGRVLIVGVYAGETVEVQLGVYWARALTLRFTGICPVHAWWERAMTAVTEGWMDPTPLISHRMALEDAAEGYALFDRRQATKVVLLP